MDVTTNHHWRPFVYRYDVPAKVLANDFDWTSEDEHIDGFFRYRGVWYHLADFERIDERSDLASAGWHGFHGDSFFSGVAIKLSDDGEEYQVATVIA